MSHQRPSSLSAKHPANTQVDDRILKALQPHMHKGKITCTEAHDLAGRIAVPPWQVGIAIDLGEARLTACQLGLFGGTDSAETDQTTEQVRQKLEPIIRKALKDNRLSCLMAWQIGQAHGVTRLQVGHICDTMGIRINKCQLGAF